MAAKWNCSECYDTETIDQGGAEIPCPYCQTPAPAVVTIRGLAHGIGAYADEYATATAHTGSTITFTGTPAAILADVRKVTSAATSKSAKAARQPGQRTNGRAGSWAVAIERRVREQLA